MKIAIDSSVFISFLGKSDRYSQESEKFMLYLDQIKPDIIIPTVVVAEVITILSMQKSKDIINILKRLLDLDPIVLDESVLRELSNILLQNNIQLKTSDLVIAATAKLFKATLITWDKKILLHDGIICPIKSPTGFSKIKL